MEKWGGKKEEINTCNSESELVIISWCLYETGDGLGICQWFNKS